MSFFLLGDATVTITHRCTPKERLKELTRLADIIIAAAGKRIRTTVKHICQFFPQLKNYRSDICHTQQNVFQMNGVTHAN